MTEIDDRISDLKRRTPGAGAVVYEPHRSASGKWEAIGPGWTVTDADPVSFAGKVEARLDAEDRKAAARSAPSTRDVRQWQYEHGERALPPPPWWLGNGLAGLVWRLVKRRNDRLRDARSRMQDSRPRNP